MSKKIAVDFDGTLCEYAFPKIGSQTPEQKELLEVLIELKKEGHKIILITLFIVVLAIFIIDGFISIEWLRKSLMLLVLVFFVLILQFFRNPKRLTHANENQA